MMQLVLDIAVFRPLPELRDCQQIGNGCHCDLAFYFSFSRRPPAGSTARRKAQPSQMANARQQIVRRLLFGVAEEVLSRISNEAPRFSLAY
ncbi:MAG: hypothetical protein ACRD9L_11805, partial [Bryobacteraceae bacterium]